MKLAACKYEAETAELLARGAWPQAASPELHAHVSACRSCGDLIAVTTMFAQARKAAVAAAPAGSPGLLWWRAQLRRRNAAMERLNRPFLRAQMFALSILCAAPLALAIFEVRQATGRRDWLKEILQTLWLQFTQLWPGWNSYLWISAGAIVALLGGVAAYLATEKP